MKILVSEFTGLGNSIMINPLIYYLKKTNEKIDVSLIGDNRYGGLDIYKYDIKINKIINFKDYTFKKKCLFFFKKINQYDFFLISAISGINIFFFFLINILYKNQIVITDNLFNFYLKKNKLLNRIVFFLSIKIRSIFKKKIKIIKLNNDMHETEANIFLAQDIIDTSNITQNNYCRFNYNFNNQHIHKYNLKNEKYICVQPLCSSGMKSTKNWGLNNFVQLCHNEIFKNYKIVLLGDKKERKIIGNDLNSNRVLNLMGETNIDDLVNLINFSKLTICHDSGILHLCELLGRISISIWGATSLKKNGPLSNQGYIIKKHHPCSPCWGTFEKNISDNEAYKNCKINFSCMKNITIEDIVTSIKKNLVNF